MSTPDALSDQERALFQAFVERRRKDSRSPESAPVEGISARTLRRYLKGEVPTRLEETTRLAMASYLASHGDHRFGDVLSDPGEGHAVSIDEWGAARARAVEKLADLLIADQETLRLRAQAAENVSRAALIEAEKAPDLSGRDLDVSSDRDAELMKFGEQWLRLMTREFEAAQKAGEAPKPAGPEPKD